MGSELLELLTTQVESQNGVVSIALSGELDLASVGVLKDRLAQVEGDGATTIMLDLRQLTFCDCSGLHAFLAARDRANTNGHRLLMIGANERARRLFDICDAGFLLDDEAAAPTIERFTGGNGYWLGRPDATGDVVADA